MRSPEPPITLMVTGWPSRALCMTCCTRAPLPRWSQLFEMARGPYCSARTSPFPKVGQKENGFCTVSLFASERLRLR